MLPAPNLTESFIVPVPPERTPLTRGVVGASYGGTRPREINRAASHFFGLWNGFRRDTARFPRDCLRCIWSFLSRETLGLGTARPAMPPTAHEREVRQMLLSETANMTWGPILCEVEGSIQQIKANIERQRQQINTGDAEIERDHHQKTLRAEESLQESMKIAKEQVYSRQDALSREGVQPEEGWRTFLQQNDNLLNAWTESLAKIESNNRACISQWETEQFALSEKLEREHKNVTALTQNVFSNLKQRLLDLAVTEASHDQIAVEIFDTLHHLMQPDKTTDLSPEELEGFKTLLQNLTRVAPKNYSEMIDKVIDTVKILLSIKEKNDLTNAHIADIKLQIETLLKKNLPRLALCLSDPTRDPIRKFPLVADTIDNYCDAILGYLAENHDPKEVERIFEKINLLGRSVITLGNIPMLNSVMRSFGSVLEKVKVLKKNCPELLLGPNAKILLNREKNLKRLLYIACANPFFDGHPLLYYARLVFLASLFSVFVIGLIGTIARAHDLTTLHPTSYSSTTGAEEAYQPNLPLCSAGFCSFVKNPNSNPSSSVGYWTDWSCSCLPTGSWWNALHFGYMMAPPNVALLILITYCSLAIILGMAILVPHLHSRLTHRLVTAW